MRSWPKRASFLCAFLSAMWGGTASARIIVLSDLRVPFNRQVYEAIKSKADVKLYDIPWERVSLEKHSDQIGRDLKLFRPEAVVVIGDIAYSLASGVKAPLIAVVGAAGDNGKPIALRLSSRPSADAVLEAALELTGQLSNLGIITAPDLDQKVVVDADAWTKKRNRHSLVTIPLGNLDALSDTLAKSASQVDTVWAPTEFVESERGVFEGLLRFSLKKQIALVVPSEQLVKKGGLLAVVVDPKEIGLQVAAAIQSVAQGARPSAPPAAVQTVVNQRTAQLLGLSVPSKLAGRAPQIVGDAP